MGSRWFSVVVDAQDPPRLARWWAEVLGFKVWQDGEEVWIARDDSSYPGLLFVPVPERKATKNRLHFDLNPDEQEAEVERLVDMGARRVDVGQGEAVSWVVLADPEGNEFCVLRARQQ
ncbi:MAG TPA: VOC family protein [Micromonosporaceae bacterium]|jgi:catechol 2,3-dioxygenase-like lactoylglutathione lyase family enzyme|nr:VOC family protein [Micromonosporaceae bacterium]